MKNSNSKRNDLIGAILSRDKDKLKKILQEGKPEKWFTISIDEFENIKIFDKSVTKQELEKFIQEQEVNYQVNLIIMLDHKLKDGRREDSWYLGGVELTLDLKR